MLFKKFNDFDELFYELTREVLLKPWETIGYHNGILAYMDNLFLACKTSDCHLDLSNFGYRSGKWGHLLRTYIDYENLVEFKKKLATSTGLSITYYFKQKKVNNGSCLIGIVLSRKSRKKKWDKVNVIHRTTEIQRRFAADLVLVHHFIKELPEETCEIGVVTFYMAQSYISAMVINGYFDYFGVPMDSLDKSHPWIKTLVNTYNKSFTEGARITTYQSMARLQKMRLGLSDFPHIPIETLSIKNHFESRGK